MSYGQSRHIELPTPETILTTVTAALIAGMALGGVLHATGQLQSVASVYGLAGVVNAWTLVFCHSLVASALFVVIVGRLARNRYTPGPLAESIRNPFPGACVGVSYGVLLWLAVVAYGVPLLSGHLTGTSYPLPYHHGASFLALTWFGLVLGAWYPLLRESFTSGR